MSILLLRYCCNVIVVNNMSTTERYNIYTLFVAQYDMSFLNENPKSPFYPAVATDGLDYTLLLSFALQDKCSLLCHFCL